MKAVRILAVFIAMTFVSSALACGNSGVSTTDQDQQQAAVRQANSILTQTASTQTVSSSTAAR